MSVFAWVPSSPTDKRPAHGNEAREVKGPKLARRLMFYQGHRGWRPAGYNAACPHGNGGRTCPD
eukprot:2921379-Pyramimonas_sp.AAC.1